MTAPLRAIAAPVVGLVLVTAAAAVQAQQAPPADQPNASELPPARQGPSAAHAPAMTPPKLKKFIEATYPPQALEQGLQARVELEVVIGPDGLVQEAKVVAPAGNG